MYAFVLFKLLLRKVFRLAKIPTNQTKHNDDNDNVGVSMQLNMGEDAIVECVEC